MSRRLLQEAEDIDPERLRAAHPQQGLATGSRGRRSSHRRAADAAVGEAAVARLPANAAPKGWYTSGIITCGAEIQVHGRK